MAHGMKAGSGHTVTAVPGTQRVTVEIDGRTVADSRHPVLVYETGLPVRFYLPPQDVELGLFDATDTHTTCPFKGRASYWTLRAEDGRPAREDVVWSYEDPIPTVAGIKGHLSFYDTVASITVEGEVQQAPEVP